MCCLTVCVCVSLYSSSGEVNLDVLQEMLADNKQVGEGWVQLSVEGLVTFLFCFLYIYFM